MKIVCNVQVDRVFNHTEDQLLHSPFLTSPFDPVIYYLILKLIELTQIKLTKEIEMNLK
jgi:hypothetical protein